MQEKFWKFPAGELGVRVPCDYRTRELTIQCNFKGSDDLIKLMLQVDAYRRAYRGVDIILHIPYFPYARQDRVMQQGESHSLKVIADLINSMNFSRVYTHDAHSDVLEALVNNLEITPQYICCLRTISLMQEYDYLVAPDAGALKKIYKLAKEVKLPVICANKVRSVETGEVQGVKISKEDYDLAKGKRLLIVDDIIDGGKTFTELRLALPEDSVVDLYATHGIFSKGKEVLKPYFRKIFCYNDMTTW